MPAESSTSPAVQSPDASSQGTERRSWRVGTLVYTGSGLVAVFAWLLLGDFAWSMRERSVGPMSQWYLKNLGVSNLIFGLLLTSLPALISLVLGPIISVRSDRHRGRLGRRIPFLLITTPLAVGGIGGLALTPVLATWVHGLIPEASSTVVALACFTVFWACYEIATIASQSVFGGLINDVVPKELLGRFHGLFRAVSLIDGIIFNYAIMGHVPHHFSLILICVGTFYGIAFTFVCLKVKEGQYPPPIETATVQAQAFQGARQYFRQCFSSPYYLWVFIMLMASGITFSPVNIFSIPYAESLNVSMERYGSCLALTYFVSLCLSYPLGWLADRFHPLRMALATLVGYLLVALWGWFNVQSEQSFTTAWVLHGVLSGCYFTSAASLGQRLFPHERYAQFASAAAMVTAPVNMVFAPLVGLIIDETGNLYRFTFLMGAILASLALGAGLVVHARFMLLGGPTHYQPPTDISP